MSVPITKPLQLKLTFNLQEILFVNFSKNSSRKKGCLNYDVISMPYVFSTECSAEAGKSDEGKKWATHEAFSKT